MSGTPRKLHVYIDVITEMHGSRVVPFMCRHFSKYTCFCISMIKIHEMMHIVKELQVNVLKDHIIHVRYVFSCSRHKNYNVVLIKK